MQVELTVQEHEVLSLALALARADKAAEDAVKAGKSKSAIDPLLDAATDAEIALADAACKLPAYPEGTLRAMFPESFVDEAPVPLPDSEVR
jgi:hypothetical protein